MVAVNIFEFYMKAILRLGCRKVDDGIIIKASSEISNDLDNLYTV